MGSLSEVWQAPLVLGLYNRLGTVKMPITRSSLVELLRAAPFEPFVVRLNDGQTRIVRECHSAAVTATQLLVGDDDSPLPDFFNISSIASIELLELPALQPKKGTHAHPPSQPSIAVSQFPNKGRGVVALRPFAAGETIERPPVIVIPKEQAPLIRDTRLAHYYFEWGDDCQQAAIALGCGSLYNHSYTPSARYEFREDEECLEFIALSDIQPGEEITINYNNLGSSATNPLKFDVK